MAQRHFSLWHVLVLLGVLVVGAGAALAGGVLIGYQWGRAATLAALPERTSAEAPVPRLVLPDLAPFEFLRPEPAAGQPYLGLTYEPLTPALAETEGLTVSDGALVRTVVPDGPAEAAGLQPGDVILSVNGQPVNADHDLREHVLALAPGDKATLRVQRGAEPVDLTVTVGERRDSVTPLPFEPMLPGQGWELHCSPPEPCRLVPPPASPGLAPSEDGKALAGLDKPASRRAPMHKEDRSLVPGPSRLARA